MGRLRQKEAFMQTVRTIDLSNVIQTDFCVIISLVLCDPDRTWNECVCVCVCVCENVCLRGWRASFYIWPQLCNTGYSTCWANGRVTPWSVFVCCYFCVISNMCVCIGHFYFKDHFHPPVLDQKCFTLEDCRGLMPWVMPCLNMWYVQYIITIRQRECPAGRQRVWCDSKQIPHGLASLSL